MVISYIPRVQRGGQLLEKSLEDAGREAYQSVSASRPRSMELQIDAAVLFFSSQTGVAPQLIVAITPDRNAYEGIKVRISVRFLTSLPPRLICSLLGSTSVRCPLQDAVSSPNASVLVSFPPIYLYTSTMLS